MSGETRTVLGLMSGTSMDGIDAAVLVTDGEDVADPGPTGFTPYTEAERGILKAGVSAARGLQPAAAWPADVARAADLVTGAHIRAIRRFLTDHPDLDIDLISLHGQTVFHAPERRLTVQVGDGEAVATEIGLPVVYDMRAADVAAGGEGAPLAPAYHRVLARRSGFAGAPVIVNIGGVSNITRIGADGTLVACDTGPGNALMDDFVLARTGQPYDRDGVLAAGGRADEQRVDRWLAAPWFDQPPPKSLDRDAFRDADVDDMTTADGLATLAAFTCRAISRGIEVAGGGDTIVVVGGGAHNPPLLERLAAVSGLPVTTGTELGWDGDFVEAQAFAYLAVRSVRGLPLTFPGTTGVPQALSGGRLASPATGSGGGVRVAV